MKKILENFIILAIILVIFQTIFEELAVVMKLSRDTKHLLIFTGFVFDAIFSLEFLLRFGLALKNKRTRKYLGSELGWIDFFSSLPLLLLNSGPMFVLLSTGDTSMVEINAGAIGVMNVLKLAKVVRVSRILRVMRFLKLLKNIKFLNSKITQKHNNFIVSTVITVMIVTIMAMNISSLWSLDNLQQIRKENYQRVLTQSLDISLLYQKDYLSEVLLPILKDDPAVFLAEFQGRNIYYVEKPDMSLVEINNVKTLEFNQLTLYYVDHDAMILEARFNLVIIFMIIFSVIALLILYARKFALEISDTMLVVEKGMSDPEYFLRLKENPERDDEVEKLARAYNDIWLPVKLKYKNEIYTENDQEFLKKMDDIDLDAILREEL